MLQIKEPCFINLNKSKGLSSASLLNSVKYELKIKKAGFCGTLDPLAQGVLVAAFGKATKLISLITDSDKEYRGKMLLGFESDSFDTDTELRPTGIKVDISKTGLSDLTARFSGEISQKPPVYSAVKVKGVRAYKLARKGENPEIKERVVNIKRLELRMLNENEISFAVECSKGTYIRSLVSDIGNAIGCKAVMTELVRVRVGDFRIDDAVTIEEIRNGVEKGIVTLDKFLSSVNKIEVNSIVYDHLRNGKEITETGLELVEGLNYIKFEGAPAFVLEKKGADCSYYAYLRD